MTDSMTIDEVLAQDFRTLPELIRMHAAQRPQHIALRQDARSLDYRALDELADRIAASLQRDGVKPKQAIAICAGTSIEYAAVFLGALRAGVAVAPLAPSSTAASIATMVGDAGATLLFVDASVAKALEPVRDRIAAEWVALDDSAAGKSFQKWLVAAGTVPSAVVAEPDAPFNLIYSSGTTGTPKGIVQSNMMRWRQWQRAFAYDYKPDSVTIVSTPLYSNTTLVSFLPTLAVGGVVVLMAKFDATRFLELAQKYRATTAMLVPVQYSRIMALPEFDRYDLTSFRAKFCTSAPFAANLKADILKRWPGRLIEYYGMTEGGGTCVLEATLHPDKLHTVGCPAPGHDIRLIDEQGRELPAGFHRRNRRTLGRHHDRLSQPAGKNGGSRMVRLHRPAFHPHRRHRPLRRRRLSDPDGPQEGHDHLGRLQRLSERSRSRAARACRCSGSRGRRCALRALGRNPGRLRRGEAAGPAAGEDAARWTNSQLGKTQRLAAVELVDSLPRSAIGKVLKRELRDAYREKASTLS